MPLPPPVTTATPLTPRSYDPPQAALLPRRLRQVTVTAREDDRPPQRLVEDSDHARADGGEAAVAALGHEPDRPPHGGGAVAGARPELALPVPEQLVEHLRAQRHLRRARRLAADAPVDGGHEHELRR